jgi:hypothetical protein
VEQPVACTLGQEDLAAQGEHWGNLGASTRVERVELSNGLRLVFARAAGVEDELAALVAIERECCAFANWTLVPDADRVALDITAEGEGIPAVQAMFGALPSARSSCC